MSTDPTKVLADDICAGSLPFEFTDLAGFRSLELPTLRELLSYQEWGKKQGCEACLDYFSRCG
jgi:hypothetical protein